MARSVSIQGVVSALSHLDIGAGTSSAVPGWVEQMVNGRRVWSGNCSQCGGSTSVPFMPIEGRRQPMCKPCFGGEGFQSQGGGIAKAAALGESKPGSLKTTINVLCVDVLNMRWYGHAGNKDHDVCLRHAAKNVARFVKAAGASKIRLLAFIDAAFQTEEAEKKWIARREKEAKTGDKGVIPGMSVVLGDLFRQHAVQVHYSTRDNDDELASYAVHMCGAVLSQDTDFFRYTGPGTPLTVFSSYAIARGQLVLEPHPKPFCKPGVQKRPVVLPPPPASTHDPSIVKLSAEGRYLRGVPSPLLKYLPNPHSTVKELRRALYWRLGFDSVEECYLEWDRSTESGSVVWVKETVTADASLSHLLDNPVEALRSMFAHEKQPQGVSDLKWAQHKFAQRAVCFELCVMGRRASTKDGGRKEMTLADLLMDSAPPQSAAVAAADEASPQTDK